MLKSSNGDYYDITEHLTQKYGTVGSETWKAEEDRAWEEYDADILRNARFPEEFWTFLPIH